MKQSRTIRTGDRVRLIGGPHTGLIGTVLSIYAATGDMHRRAFVEIALFDGPHRITVAMRMLEKAE